MMPKKTKALPQPHAMQIGKSVPDFTLASADGKEHSLSEFRGSKVLLTFHRFSYCPFCAYSVHKLIGNYKKLAWASKLKVIIIFQTDEEYLRKGMTDKDAPLTRFCNIFDVDNYPFLALADAKGSVSSMYQVEYTTFVKQFLQLDPAYKKELMDIWGPSPRKLLYTNDMRKSAFKVKGANTLLPSEFLIDEDGILVDVFRAKEPTGAIDVDRISHFLLMGQRLPDAAAAAPAVKSKYSRTSFHFGKSSKETVEEKGISVSDGSRRRTMNWALSKRILGQTVDERQSAN